MAALLAIFKSSVPPVVKKHIRNLLVVIREAVTRGLGPGGAKSQPTLTETQAQTQDAQKKKDVVTLASEIKNLERINIMHDNSDIWGHGAYCTTLHVIWANFCSATGRNQSGSSAPHSVLLGTVKSTIPKLSTFSTSVSSLFGAKGAQTLVGIVFSIPKQYLSFYFPFNNPVPRHAHHKCRIRLKPYRCTRPRRKN